MASIDTRTTLVCLFHHQAQAKAALEDLQRAGLPQDSLTTIGGDGASVDALDKSELASLEMPDKDYDHLKKGIAGGGIVVAVAAVADHIAAVEKIFQAHSAEKIDEADVNRDALPLAAAAEQAIPVVEEELVVGKRTVDQGGVRVYRRVVEIPVEESINLREEHVNVARTAVDRPATEADLAFGDRSIELTETAEEAVVSKSAHVVEEVVVGKESSEHTQVISDTVRRTEVEVEEVPASTTSVGRTGSSY